MWGCGLVNWAREPDSEWRVCFPIVGGESVSKG